MTKNIKKFILAIDFVMFVNTCIFVYLDPGDYEIRKPKTVFPMKFLFMPQDMENYVFGAESSRYLREVNLAPDSLAYICYFYF